MRGKVSVEMSSSTSSRKDFLPADYDSRMRTRIGSWGLGGGGCVEKFNPELKLTWNLNIYRLYLDEPDDVGEDQEGGDVIHPLQQPEEYEGAAVYDEAGRKDSSHSPDGQVLAHQGP